MSTRRNQFSFYIPAALFSFALPLVLLPFLLGGGNVATLSFGSSSESVGLQEGVILIQNIEAQPLGSGEEDTAVTSDAVVLGQGAVAVAPPPSAQEESAPANAQQDQRGASGLGAALPTADDGIVE